MDQEQLKKFAIQGLAMANNHLFMGRPNKAVEIIVQVKKVRPEDEVADRMMALLFSVQEGLPWPTLDDVFGVRWKGEDLEGKSIEIFSDLDLEETLKTLPLVQRMKARWNCRVVLNCYRHNLQLKLFSEKFPYIDEFTGLHIKCDHNTDITEVLAFLEVGFT